MHKLELVREFAAARERVWRAWTKPETHIAVVLEETTPGHTRMHFTQVGLVSTESKNGHAEG